MPTTAAQFPIARKCCGSAFGWRPLLLPRKERTCLPWVSAGAPHPTPLHVPCRVVCGVHRTVHLHTPGTLCAAPTGTCPGCTLGSPGCYAQEQHTASPRPTAHQTMAPYPPTTGTERPGSVSLPFPPPLPQSARRGTGPRREISGLGHSLDMNGIAPSPPRGTPPLAVPCMLPADRESMGACPMCTGRLSQV